MEAPDKSYYEDMYGDFESMVEERRLNNIPLPQASAQQVASWNSADNTLGNWNWGIEIKDQGARAKDAIEQLQGSNQFMSGLWSEYGAKNKSLNDADPGSAAKWFYTGRYQYSQGFVEEYYFEQRCERIIIIPGTSLLNPYMMFVVYGVWLIWMFVGIAIISDIFMESIEVITSSTRPYKVYDDDKQEYVVFEHKVWNETIANLSLMALGSSAPEILLNVLMTAVDIGGEPSELGPSTIVGSAAFNLLVISGVSIIAVGTDKDPSYKKID